MLNRTLTSNNSGISIISGSISNRSEHLSPNVGHQIPDLDSPIHQSTSQHPSSASNILDLDNSDNTEAVQALRAFTFRSNIPLNKVKDLVGIIKAFRDFDSEIPSVSSIIPAISPFLKKTIFVCQTCSSHLDNTNFCFVCNIQVTSPASYAIGDLDSQLKNIFEDSPMTQKLFDTHDGLESGALLSKDVYFGSVYRDFLAYKSRTDISLCINTDGFKVFNTSKREPWGIYCTINELPFETRSRPSNMVILAIYHGSKKPEFNKILPDLVDMIKSCQENGVLISGHHFRPFVLQNCCDKPARSALLSHSGHRSEYGCIKCLVQQTHTRIGTRSFYSFPVDEMNSLLRDDISFKSDAIISVNSGNTFGIRDYSRILDLGEFRPVSGSIIDQLHCIGGVGKKVLELLISRHPQIVEHTKNSFASLRPPNTLVSRVRNLENLVNFRGHEFRSFFLFYGPIILEFLPPQELMVIKGLNQIIFLSNADTITTEKIQELQQTIDTFIRNVRELFGDHVLTINFHELAHLPDDMRYNGAGFANSCYIFENFNGVIGKMIHGTNFVGPEIFKRFFLYSSSFHSKDNEFRNDGLGNFVKDIFKPKHAKVTKIVNHIVSICGPYHIFHFRGIDPNAQVVDIEGYRHFRALFRKTLITSTTYDENLKFSNSLVFSSRENFCFKICYFITSLDVLGETYAVGQYFDANNIHSNIFERRLRHEDCCLKMSEDYIIVFEINERYFSIPPNSVELY